MKYAIALMNFFDNDLQIKIVTGVNWKDALLRAFPIMEWLTSTDLVQAKEEAWDGDVLFEVEII